MKIKMVTGGLIIPGLGSSKAGVVIDNATIDVAMSLIKQGHAIEVKEVSRETLKKEVK